MVGDIGGRGGADVGSLLSRLALTQGRPAARLQVHARHNRSICVQFVGIFFLREEALGVVAARLLVLFDRAPECRIERLLGYEVLGEDQHHFLADFSVNFVALNERDEASLFNKAERKHVLLCFHLRGQALFYAEAHLDKLDGRTDLLHQVHLDPHALEFLAQPVRRLLHLSLQQ